MSGSRNPRDPPLVVSPPPRLFRSYVCANLLANSVPRTFGPIRCVLIHLTSSLLAGLVASHAVRVRAGLVAASKCSDSCHPPVLNLRSHVSDLKSTRIHKSAESASGSRNFFAYRLFTSCPYFLCTRVAESTLCT